MIRFFLCFVLCFLSLNAKTLSTEEMVSQMIVIGFDGYKEGDKWVEQIAKDIKREKIGGVVLDGKNVQNATQLKKLTQYLKSQASAKLPLLVIATEEGGEDAFLSPKKGFSFLPLAYEMAKNKDIEEAQKLYAQRAQELANSGITINFAPVLDLQPKNPPTLMRSYASYEEIVTTYATLFMNALQSNNVLSIVKYFPTAGENLRDDFASEVDVTDSWRFEQLKPYYDLIAFGKVDGVLMSHVIHKELDKHNPALFSSTIIEGLLRGKMHFEGVVFVDNLRTNSLPNSIDFRTRVIRSIQAGADVLVFSNYFADNASMPFTVNKIIMDAIRSGELTKERIALSYERIEKLKQKSSQRHNNAD